MTERNYGTYGRCTATAKSTGEQCKRAAISAAGVCKLHGGESTGPNDTTYLEGNDHAKGNAGGSPPEGNQNALKTGLHASPVNLFEWLLEEDRAAAMWVLNKLYDYSKRAPEQVYVATFTPEDVDSYEDATMNLTAYGDDLLQICIRDYARWQATKRQLQEGVISEQEQFTENGVWKTEDANPVNLELDRMDKTTMRQKDKLGLLPSPGREQAKATNDLGEMVRQALEEED